MDAILDQILSLSRQQKIGILAGLILALVGLDYTFLYSPQAYRIADLSDQIQSSRTERDKKKNLASSRPKLEKELQLRQGMLKEAIAQLPSRREIPDLLSGVSNKAREAGLDIILFRPRGENVQEFYAEIPVDVVVRGDFHNVVVFFDEVGRMNRIVNINNIELKNSAAKDNQSTMEVSTLATTFRFLDQAERAKIAAEKAAKEKAANK